MKQTHPYMEFCILNYDQYVLSFRYFDKNVYTSDLNWHMDKEDRNIIKISGKEYYLQFDNCLPVKLEKDKIYYIPKNTWHRLIKSSDDSCLIMLKKWKTNEEKNK